MEKINYYQESYNKAVEEGSSELANWSIRNVPKLIAYLTKEHELAEMYRGLCK